MVLLRVPSILLGVVTSVMQCTRMNIQNGPQLVTVNGRL
jgi:hypothetical protein